MKDDSKFKDFELIEKFDSEFVNCVRIMTGIEEPNANILREFSIFVASVKILYLNGGTTP